MIDKNISQLLDNWDLISSPEFGNMDSAELLDLAKRMNRYKELRNKYKDKIKTRKDGRQVYVLIDRKQITAKDEDTLIDKLYALEYGIESSSMEDLFTEWLKWKRDNTNAAGSTLRNYTYDWNKHFKGDAITQKSMKELTAKDFTHLFRKWSKSRQMTQKAFNNAKSIINGLFSYAINELEIVNVNPIREIDMRQFPMKPVKAKQKVFTIEDRELILNYLKNKEEDGIDELYSLAIQFDFHVTLRIGELMALRWDNIQDNQIYVEYQKVRTTTLEDDGTFTAGRYENVDHIKGNTDLGYRWIPLTKSAIRILKRVREINPDGEYIFMYNGKQIYNATFNEHLKSYCDELGIKGAQDKSSHIIRFTVASVLYLKGMPLTDLQRLMGHTSLGMTMHYLRQILPEKNTAKMMEQFLDEPEENNSPVPPDPNLPSESAGNIIVFPTNVNRSFQAKNA